LERDNDFSIVFLRLSFKVVRSVDDLGGGYRIGAVAVG
jgi:hypothetical protein